MKTSRSLLTAACVLYTATAWGQTAAREPHIGYLYPGGGRQGEVVHVVAGGQVIRGAKRVHVTGEGVRAKVVEFYRSRNINGDRRRELQARLRDVRRKRLNDLPAKSKLRTQLSKEIANETKAADKNKKKLPQNFRPYEHPMLYDVETKSLRELAHLSHEIFFPRAKKQTNAQLGELALIEVTIDYDAAPGDREIRIEAALGLTNPMVFQVGQMPEVRELEPNNRMTDGNWAKAARLPERPPFDLPVIMNGRIMPGDSDKFRFRAEKGQKLVMQVSARRLVPFLADAVPGWFQATLTLCDAQGNEVAFRDDYMFDPDPVLFYEVLENGVYELEIHDSIYRGRQDFVYRIAVGEQPFVTSVYPLGGRAGVIASSRATGWNFPGKDVMLDTRPGAVPVREMTLNYKDWVSNSFTYSVDTLPEFMEKEPNDTAEKAQRIDLPVTVNGRITRPDDVDVFRIDGRAGDEIVVKVDARRLHSPLDSVVRLTDAAGTVLEWNDDHVEKEGHLHTDMGLITHHADSYLRAALPKHGDYYVHISDVRQHGGETYGYRMKVGPPRIDFELRITPSSLNIPAGRSAPVCVHALRKDGFDGAIDIVLKEAAAGFTLSGGRIPAGQNSVRMTIKAPSKRKNQPVALNLEGRAGAGGRTVSRMAVPSEDMMQAFLWRHLVPSRELLVSVRKPSYTSKLFDLAGAGPVRIPVAGGTRMRVSLPKNPKINKVELKLNEPPEGLSLTDVKPSPGGIEFRFKVDGDGMEPGLEDNLIVEAFAQYTSGNAKDNKKRRRISLGVLPAIPFEVVQ